MKAYFAGGCFWCVTPVYKMLGADKVTSGFSGGKDRKIALFFALCRIQEFPFVVYVHFDREGSADGDERFSVLHFA